MKRVETRDWKYCKGSTKRKVKAKVNIEKEWWDDDLLGGKDKITSGGR